MRAWSETAERRTWARCGSSVGLAITKSMREPLGPVPSGPEPATDQASTSWASRGPSVGVLAVAFMSPPRMVGCSSPARMPATWRAWDSRSPTSLFWRWVV